MDNHPLMVMHLLCYGESGLAEKLRAVRDEKKHFSDQGILINGCSISEQPSVDDRFRIQIKVDGGGQSFVMQGFVNKFFLKIEETSSIILAKSYVSGKKEPEKTPYFISIDKTLQG